MNEPGQITGTSVYWVDEFLAATETLSAPYLFRKWGAISAVAGALERKVWLRTSHGALYPNLYTVLVAPPSVGKTEITERVRSLWRMLPEHHVAGIDLSKATLIDQLNEANRNVHNTGGIPASINFHSLLVPVNELGVFLPAYDLALLNTLTDLYDCKSYSERKRGRDIKINMENCQINILAACTPSYLTTLLPEGAWDQGFTSRVLFIYSAHKIYKPLFINVDNSADAQIKTLVPKFRAIANRVGEMKIEAEAANIVEEWHKSGGEPKPTHPKLLYYAGRRTVQLLKLCMVATASRNEDLVITAEDVRTALDWLMEAEAEMGNIFKVMGAGSNAQLLRETWHFIFEQSQLQPDGVTTEEVYAFISDRVPSYQVETVLNVMEKSGMIGKKITAAGNTIYAKGRQS